MNETQLIKRIVSRMLRNPNSLPIGLELLNHDICFLDLLEDIPAFKNADTIYLNRSSRFIQTRDMEKSVTFLLLHEAIHTLFFHDQRLESKDPALWGMATDYMTDALIVYLITATTSWTKKVATTSWIKNYTSNYYIPEH